MIDSAVSEGYNVIVMPGYAFGGAIVDAAPNYPDVKFIALDVAKGDLLEAAVAAKGEEYDYNPDNWELADYFDMSNVYCVVYQEELAGYMAGYAAVKLGYTDLGFLGGMQVPAVVRYESRSDNSIRLSRLVSINTDNLTVFSFSSSSLYRLKHRTTTSEYYLSTICVPTRNLSL